MKQIFHSKVVIKNVEAFCVVNTLEGFVVFPIRFFNLYIHKTEEAAMYELTHYFNTKEMDQYFEDPKAQKVQEAKLAHNITPALKAAFKTKPEYFK